VVDVLCEPDEAARSDLLKRMEPKKRHIIDTLLAYPEDSAGAIMTTEFVSVPSTWTVAQTLDHIRKRRAHARDCLLGLRASSTHQRFP
jgi:magnesium transporter